MPEYYVVLKKAVAGADSGSADGRRAVYDKARNALISQLKAIDPPLASSEISRQRLELEEAIRRVERETASEARDARRLRPRDAELPPIPTPDMGTSSPPEPNELSPQDLFRQAIQKAENRSPRSPTLRARRSDQIDEPERESDPGSLAQGGRSDFPGAEFNDDPTDQIVPNRDVAGPPRDVPLTMTPEPHLDRRDLPNLDEAIDLDQADRGGIASSERRARRSRFPTIMLFVLIIGMIGGLGFLAWTQGELIAEIASDFNLGGSQDTTLADSATSAPDVAVTKSNDRVLGDPESGSDPIADAITSAPDLGAGTPGASGNALGSLKATLYEEPLNSATGTETTTALDARVTWRFVESGTSGPEVEANIEVPERGLKARLVIGKNTDPGLPASHMVVTTIEIPENFHGRGISRLPVLVMKVAEDGNGQPLIGQDAKISGDLFWIALSSADVDIERNQLLMRDRGWIDLPLVYESGQRAILTFEKGAIGQGVFEQALAAWAAS